MAGHNQQFRKHPLPPIDMLRENLRYIPETGELWWTLPLRGRSLDRQAGSFTGRVKRCRVGFTFGDRLITLLRSRVAFALMEGRWPDCIDHINGDPLDDRWANLREATNADNGKNRKKETRNKSGVTGVCWGKWADKWNAYISVDGRDIFLGRYGDFFEAVCARKSAELKYGFHENHGR